MIDRSIAAQAHMLQYSFTPLGRKLTLKKIKDSVSRQYFLLFTRNIFILPSRSLLEIRNGRNGTIGFKPS